MPETTQPRPTPTRDEAMKAFARLWADWAHRQAEKQRKDAASSRLR